MIRPFLDKLAIVRPLNVWLLVTLNLHGKLGWHVLISLNVIQSLDKGRHLS